MKHLFLIAGAAFLGYAVLKRQQTQAVSTLPPTPISSSPATLDPGIYISSGDTPAALGTDAAGNNLSQLPSPDAVTHSVNFEDFEHINPFSTAAM